MADRADNLATGSAEIRETLSKLYDTVEKGFNAQIIRANDIKDYWGMYNSVLSEGQLYSGRNRLFAPIIYEAVQARSTRVINQLFPQTGRHIEATSVDGTLPRAALAVGEYYVDEMGLQGLMPALFVAGDIEGQYNLYLSWQEGHRRTLSRVDKSVELSPGVEAGIAKDTLEEDIPLGAPRTEVLSDVDVCILPATSASLEDALATGGSVAIIRRWGKHQIKALIEDGSLDKEEANKVIESIDSYTGIVISDASKDLVKATGIMSDGRGKWAQIIEIWTELDTEEGMRLCQVFMAGKDNVLIARRNPLWCDRCPLLSVPVKRVLGSVKGLPPVAAVKKLQYFANDVLNEGADSALLALLPITLRDPAYITAPLILAPGAVWDVPPGAVSFAEIPSVWERTMEVLSSIKAEIFQVLSVNAAMITQGTYRKQTQAEVAQEQQIDILTTNNTAQVLEEGILTPLANLIMDMDYQYRDNELIVRAFGETGVQSNLEVVPPFEIRTRYMFRWVGIEATRSQQMMQQKIAAMNVIKAIPPQMYPGYQFDMQPLIVDIIESVYGARLGRLVLKDIKSQATVDPSKENELLVLGHYVQVHPMDDPQQHMMVHKQSIEMDGDPFGAKQAHLQEHAMVFMMKQQVEQQAAVGGAPGPREGAQPGQQRPAQAPPGAIHDDRIGREDPSVFPRE